MGLDQYAYKVKRVRRLTDFEYPKNALVDKDFDYWRKFYGLQNWMENLYREKGGNKCIFNCVPLRLTEQDLDRLERDSKEDVFYSERYCETLVKEKEYEGEHLKAFIQNAKQALFEGYAVYYNSWW